MICFETEAQAAVAQGREVEKKTATPKKTLSPKRATPARKPAKRAVTERKGLRESKTGR